MTCACRPSVGAVLQRLLKPSPRSVVQMMGLFGEGKTIVDHPDQVDALVAAGRDPVAARANRAETAAVGSAVTGIRPQFRLKPQELAGLAVPTLLIWGEADPIAAATVARAAAEAIPEVRLELLSAGHVPWFAEPDRTAELVSDFVR